MFSCLKNKELMWSKCLFTATETLRKHPWCFTDADFLLIVIQSQRNCKIKPRRFFCNLLWNFTFPYWPLQCFWSHMTVRSFYLPIRLQCLYTLLISGENYFCFIILSSPATELHGTWQSQLLKLIKQNSSWLSRFLSCSVNCSFSELFLG